jgi:mitogen-activated protein kinase organizer 1
MNLEAKIDCQQGAVRAVRFNKDGNYCVTCGNDKTVKLWNPYKKLKLQTYSGHSQEVLGFFLLLFQNFLRIKEYAL